MEIVFIVCVVIVLLVLWVRLANYLGTHKKGNCDICGKEMGIKGNKSFDLKDGRCCENCLNKAELSPKTAAHKAFTAWSVQRLKDKQAEVIEMAEIKRERIRNPEAFVEADRLAAERLASIPVRTSPPVKNKDLVSCPKCGSTQITANKKGVSVGKAVVGGILTGGAGVVAGALGSDKVIITCLKCGNKWQAGKK